MLHWRRAQHPSRRKRLRAGMGIKYERSNSGTGSTVGQQLERHAGDNGNGNWEWEAQVRMGR